jgi:hypothetical protein
MLEKLGNLCAQFGRWWRSQHWVHRWQELQRDHVLLPRHGDPQRLVKLETRLLRCRQCRTLRVKVEILGRIRRVEKQQRKRKTAASLSPAPSPQVTSNSQPLRRQT